MSGSTTDVAVLGRLLMPDGQDAVTDAFGLLRAAPQLLLAPQNPAARTLGEMGARALVMLGESGLGKSALLRARADQLRGAGERVHLVDLGASASEERVLAAIVDAPPWLDWLDAGEEEDLHLLLDAFDEARLRNTTISELIVEALEGAPTERLRLTFACRPGLWPAALDERLAQLVAEPPQHATLLGLTADQIAAWAEAAGLDGGGFVEQVATRGLAGLASRPLTLKLLLAEYGAGLPASEWDVFERGLRALCAEPDEDRALTVDTAPLLGAAERLAVARRVAAATVLGGRVAVRRSSGSGGSVDAVSVDELVGGCEPDRSGAVERPVEVTVRELGDLLRSGLFSAGRVADELRFAHASYAEHLAASWLAVHLPGARSLDVLADPDDEQRRIVPQLRAVAARLAAVDVELREHLLTGEADLLLASAPAVGPAEREQLVGALLELAGQGRLDPWAPELRGRLASLVHPNLAVQLRGMLGDAAAPGAARELAAAIAQAAPDLQLGELLVELALGGHGASVALRERAVRAVAALGDDRLLGRLAPLAANAGPDDVDDEVRGAALLSLWPRHLSPDELFGVLAPPRSSLIGNLSLFLRGELLQGLSGEGLSVALSWAAANFQPYDDDALADLAGAIVERGWAERERPGVLDALASALASILERCGDLGDRPLALLDEPQGRRAIAQRTVGAVLGGGVGERAPFFCSPPLLIAGDDLGWLLERLAAARHTPAAWVWARWAAQAWRPEVPAETEAVVDAAEGSALLSALIGWRLQPWPLDSPAAELGRQRAREKQERAKRVAARRGGAIGRPLLELVEQTLTRGEGGDIAAWADLSWQMAAENSRARYRAELDETVIASPGWASADAETRTRILALARTFLEGAEPPQGSWLADAEIPREVIAGVRALELVVEQDDGWAELERPALWERWAPALVGLPGGMHGAQRREATCRRAHALAPTALRAALLAHADGEAHWDGRMWVLERFAWAWDAHLERELIARLDQGDLPVDAARTIVALGLRSGSEALGRRAGELVLAGAGASTDTPTAQLARACAALLVEHAPDAGFSVLWPLLREQAAFGAQVMLEVAGLHGPSLISRAPTAALGELVAWLLQTFPPEQDPPLDGGGLSPRAVLAFWRGRLLSELAAAGTAEALAAVRALTDVVGPSPLLARVRLEAEEAHRQGRWRPPAPVEVVRLGLRASARIVRSDRDLQRVLAEQLADIARELRTSTAVLDLWGTGRPKSEEECSAWLERHLRERLRGRGIVVNREVEVRRRAGPGVGERTDLLVSAQSGQPVVDPPLVEVVLEVKGCWNAGLRTDMDTQLARRYLDDEGRRCGIYIALHFSEQGWTAAGDRRRAVCRNLDPEALARELDAQASALTKPGGRSLLALVIDASQPARS